MTPSEVSLVWSTGMNGTGPCQRDLPAAVGDLEVRGVPVADQVDADAVDDQRVVDLKDVVPQRGAGLRLVAQRAR